MAGRLITHRGLVKLSTTNDNSWITRFAPRSDVSWKALVLSSGYYPVGLISDTAGTRDSLWEMRVNGVTVLEVSWNTTNWGPRTIVIPWGDGIRFTASETVGVIVTDIQAQVVCSAAFFGTQVT